MVKRRTGKGREKLRRSNGGQKSGQAEVKQNGQTADPQGPQQAPAAGDGGPAAETDNIMVQKGGPKRLNGGQKWSNGGQTLVKWRSKGGQTAVKR